MNRVHAQVSRPAEGIRFAPLGDCDLAALHVLDSNPLVPVYLAVTEIVKMGNRDLRQPAVFLGAEHLELATQNPAQCDPERSSCAASVAAKSRMSSRR